MPAALLCLSAGNKKDCRAGTPGRFHLKFHVMNFFDRVLIRGLCEGAVIVITVPLLNGSKIFG
jgi:hypothetical protein